MAPLEVVKLSPLKVLIADDDPDDAEFLLESMQSQEPSLAFFAVENGAQLLDFMAGKRRSVATLPDLVIVDVNMPVMDGLTAMRRLQKLHCFDQIPKFVLTTSGDPLLQQQCLDAGARKVFIKPSSVQGMTAIAAEILSASHVPSVRK